ncbi:MAG: GxxExxY protein [Chitinophagaceae bacterium]|nr:GxxExxY protein [Chitinophagaceae bacterium]
MTENELAKIVVDLCFKIHIELGPGLLESIYEAALCYELDQAGVPYQRQHSVPVIYKGVPLGLGFRVDLLVGGKLLVELKSIERLDRVHHKILITYLKLTGAKLGILVNFNVALLKEGIHRRIYGQLSE